MDITWTVGLASVASVIVYCLVTKSNNKSSLHNTPPCLPSLPIIGSLPFLGGAKNAHVNLFNLTKKYGNVYGLYFGSKYNVVLNGYDAIKEALVKNGVAVADRGRVVVDVKIWAEAGRGIILRPFNAEYQTIRHISTSVLKSLGFGSQSVMESGIQTESTHLIEHIASLNGKDWYPGILLESATLNVIYNLMFGERFHYDDELGHLHISGIRSISEAADVLYDVFPLLMEIPPFRGKLAKHRKICRNWINTIDNKVKQVIAEAQENNFISDYVKLVGGEKNISARELAIIIKDLMIGGTEAGSVQLNWILIFLANHPEAQSKLHQEIDSVVERGILPSLDDKPKLPYLEATILEVMRIRTALPLSIPRFTHSEIKLGKYTIPAESGILVNLWSAHMDPEVWPEPEIFRPERFLDDNGEVTKREMMITFSYGKRSCLGEVLARQQMFLFSAAMIQNFRILPPEGEDKVKVEMQFQRALSATPHMLRLVSR